MYLIKLLLLIIELCFQNLFLNLFRYTVNIIQLYNIPYYNIILILTCDCMRFRNIRVA